MNREHRESEIKPAEQTPQVPWLEWLASGVGLLLVLGVFGVIGWQAVNGSPTPPVIAVEVEGVGPVEGGYRVLFRARNSTDVAAAQVEIKGRVTGAGTETETSRVVLDYIPGHSARRGGLFFTRDPRSGALAVRATGFSEP
jgi:uncharacterized protein (TIGR02588 family)